MTGLSGHSEKSTQRISMMSSYELKIYPERPQRIKGKFIKGHNPWHKGKKGIKWMRSPEIEAKCRANLKPDNSKGKKPWNYGTGKKVLMFKNGVEIGCFDSARACERETGICNQSIYRVLKGVQNQTNGYTFKYLDNEKG